MLRRFCLATLLVMAIPLAYGQEPGIAEHPAPAEMQASVAEETVQQASAQTDTQQQSNTQPVIAATETFRLKQETPRAEGTSMGAASLQMTLGLFAVLGVILGLSWLARRFNLAGVGGVAGLKINSALNVGPKEKIMVLEVEGQRLLVGVTSHQITLLQQLGHAPENTTASDFAHRMQTLLKAGSLNEK